MKWKDNFKCDLNSEENEYKYSIDELIVRKEYPYLRGYRSTIILFVAPLTGYNINGPGGNHMIFKDWEEDYFGMIGSDCISISNEDAEFILMTAEQCSELHKMRQ